MPPFGRIIITEPGMPDIERDAYLCAHCQLMCVVVPGSGKTRGFCLLCYSPTCGREECGTTCVPYEAKLEAQEGTRRFYKQTKLNRLGQIVR